MRHHFQSQPDLQITPIEKIRLPLQSRDELPPILAGLQWIWMQPSLKAEMFALLEAKILAGKQRTGRTGIDLWQILVLGVVRLGRQLEHHLGLALRFLDRGEVGQLALERALVPQQLLRALAIVPEIGLGGVGVEALEPRAQRGLVKAAP